MRAYVQLLQELNGTLNVTRIKVSERRNSCFNCVTEVVKENSNSDLAAKQFQRNMEERERERKREINSSA